MGGGREKRDKQTTNKQTNKQTNKRTNKQTNTTNDHNSPPGFFQIHRPNNGNGINEKETLYWFDEEKKESMIKIKAKYG